MAFCINTVYFTPKIPNLYLPKCGPYDGGIKLLNLFDTFKKWQILVGRQQNFPKCQRNTQNLYSQSGANGQWLYQMPNRKRNIRNFPFDHT